MLLFYQGVFSAYTLWNLSFIKYKNSNNISMGHNTYPLLSLTLTYLNLITYNITEMHSVYLGHR